MVGELGVIRPLPPQVNYAARPLAYMLGMAAMNAREAINEVRREIDARHPSGVRPDMARQKLGDVQL